MAGNWLHVPTVRAVIIRTGHLQGKYRCHPTVLAWGGLRFQSILYAYYMCLFRLAKSLQILWMCEHTAVWNPCELRAVLLRPVEIFHGVVLVCCKLCIPGGRISDYTRPLGGGLDFLPTKFRIIIIIIIIIIIMHVLITGKKLVFVFFLERLLPVTSYNSHVLC
jgi:Ni/Fe-hydrogenase subunit HybB-like protein